MAYHLRGVINATGSAFTLTQMNEGVQVLVPPDQTYLPIPENALTVTGGTDNNWIFIPDATPPNSQYFGNNHTSLTVGQTSIYVYKQSDGTKCGTAYWDTQIPNPNLPGTAFPNSGIFEEGFLVISQEGDDWNLALYDVNAL